MKDNALFSIWAKRLRYRYISFAKNILIYVTVRGSPKAVKLFGVILCVCSFFTTKHYSTHGTHQFYYYMKKTQTRKNLWQHQVAEVLNKFHLLLLVNNYAWPWKFMFKWTWIYFHWHLHSKSQSYITQLNPT